MDQIVQAVVTGQAYDDLDGRRAGRSFKVEAILNDGRALIRPLFGGSKMTKISLDRFKPWKYKLQQSCKTSIACDDKTVQILVPANITQSLATQSLATQSLASHCNKIMPAKWQSKWTNTAFLKQGCIGVIVRSFDNSSSFDVKIQLNDLIIYTHSARNVFLKDQLKIVRDKLMMMRDDFTNVMNF
ncbi:MAG: hypothetical protein Q8P20_00345 [bacterium]|nr:hypothetical protein [bacterium]